MRGCAAAWHAQPLPLTRLYPYLSACPLAFACTRSHLLALQTCMQQPDATYA